MSKLGPAGAALPTRKVFDDPIIRGTVVPPNPTMPQARAAVIGDRNIQVGHISQAIRADLGKLNPVLAAGVRRVAGTK